MAQKSNRAALKAGIKAYRSSIRNEKNETRNCVFHLDVLRDFLKAIDDYKGKEKIDGVRIYLVRTDICRNVKKLKDGKTNQIGFIIVPAYNFKGIDPKITATDCLNLNLNWIIPGYSNETGGLCPDNCGGSNPGGG